MDILDSAWLIRMLKKSADTPQARLLTLFDILSDWADAPNVRPALAQEMGEAGTMPGHLLAYLTEQARDCGAQLPEALAQQLYFIALGALQESLRTSEQAHFSHARLAAAALVAAQTERERYAKKPLLYGAAVGLVLITLLAGGMLYQHLRAPGLALPATAAIAAPAPETVSPAQEEGTPSPKHAADMYASLEQMRRGDCHYVEVLQIPDADKKVYMENVVGAKVPGNARDFAVAQRYLQKIQCSYTPMLMRNSVN